MELFEEIQRLIALGTEGEYWDFKELWHDNKASTQLTHLADALEHASGSERVKLTKQQKKLQDQSLEIQKYEEKIHHLADQNISIDLDDGVKHNYVLFADVLAKIK